MSVDFVIEAIASLELGQDFAMSKTSDSGNSLTQSFSI
jgi:hypothetical protein